MRKIMIVDDEHDICDFVKNFFQERGYSVAAALSGEEALEMVKKDRPDLILLDVKMKGMDGIATLRHLKAMDKSQNVIMVTALEDQDKIDEACRLGACEYITKPLTLDHLESAVEKTFKNMDMR